MLIDIVNYIPEGCEHAISRRNLCIATGLNDRVVRELIEEARRTTIIISNTDGSGYWLYPETPTQKEIHLLNRYVKQQERRAKSIFYALKPARKKIQAIEKGGGTDGGRN